MAIDNIYW